MVKLIANPDAEFHAHNAGFEIAIWDAICVGRWGWPAIPLERWYCTAAKAASANLPRSLDFVTRVLEVGKEHRKDKGGKDLIKLLSVPTKAQKTYKRIRKNKDGSSVKDKNGRVVKDVNKLSEQYAREVGWPLFPGDYPGALYFFNEDPEPMDKFCRYNIQDIVAEIAAHKAIPASHALEREVWLMDQRINQRGIPVDVDLCRGALEVHGTEMAKAASEVEELTDGAVTKLTQRQRILNWINQRYNWGENLREQDIIDGLKLNDLPDNVRRVLELRAIAGGTAVAKYQATLNAVSADGRARGQLLYYGATTTGRWAGRGLQPHNFKRAATLPEDYVDAIKTGCHDDVEALALMMGTTVQKVLQGCLRGIVCAEPGKVLLFSDFAGIESRVLNWICGNQTKVDLFAKGQDAYIHTARDVYECAYEDIADWNGKKWKIKKEHSEKRQIGKACELGLGYGMGFKTFQVNAANAGSILTDSFANEVVNKWRAANPEIPKFWRDIENAAVAAVKQNKPGRVNDVNGLQVFVDGKGYLCVKLPSGRCLRYFQPTWMEDKRPLMEGDDPSRSRFKLFYRDGGKTGHNANKGKIDTYGGKLTENIVQAASRDLLVYSMLIVQREGIPIIFHVHDEVVTEVDEDHAEDVFKVVHQAMETLPDWAAGLPLAAETQLSRRFTK
jgi:DNA polymerase